MPTHRTTFTTVRTEGAILPADLLQRIADGDASLGGLTPEAYHLAAGVKINEAINRAWNRCLGAWASFQSAAARLPENDLGTSITRERWLLPLFQELGYGRLVPAKAIEIGYGRGDPARTRFRTAGRIRRSIWWDRGSIWIGALRAWPGRRAAVRIVWCRNC
jgi:hypothetical protein